jgi:hypothetical protein
VERVVSTVVCDADATEEEALNQEFPNRFADPLNRPHPAYAAHFIYSFLEGSIAVIADREGLFESNAQSLNETFEQLIYILESTESTTTSCRAMSHLTTETGKPIHIGDFTVHPENGSFDSMIEITEGLVPNARNAFGLKVPNFYDPPHSLIVRSVAVNEVSETDYFYDTYLLANNLTAEIEKFLLLDRLLHSGSHQSCWQLIGESALVSRS